MKISVVIPAYEMFGYGAAFLSQSFDILSQQDFQDFEVVVGDQSNDGVVAELCATWRDRLRIKHIDTSSSRGSPSANVNGAYAHADGEIIKLLFQDDLLACTGALGRIARAFDESPTRNWLLSAFHHTHDGVLGHRPFLPMMHGRTRYGANLAGPPSIMAIRRRSFLPFDPDVSWLMDVKVYAAALEQLGPPIVLSSCDVISREWARQNTFELADARKRREELDALELPALERGLLAPDQAHAGHARLHATLIGREHAVLGQDGVSNIDRQESVDRLLSLFPLDRRALLESYAAHRPKMNAAWRQAATRLMSFYTSDQEVTTSVATELRRLPDDQLGELRALRDYLAAPSVCQFYPVHLLKCWSPADLPPDVDAVLEKLSAPATLLLELEGVDNAQARARQRITLLRSVLETAWAALVAAGKKPAVSWAMSRDWHRIVDTPARPLEVDFPSIFVALHTSAAERARMIREAVVSPFGFVVAVDFGGDGSAMPRPRVAGAYRPFLSIGQVFI